MAISRIVASVATFAGGVAMALMGSPTASAEMAPVAEGMYVMTDVSSGDVISADTQVRWDCGPGCYTLDALEMPGPGSQYRLDPASNIWYDTDWHDKTFSCTMIPGGQGGDYTVPEKFATADGISYFTQINATTPGCGLAVDQLQASLNELAGVSFTLRPQGVPAPNAAGK